MTRRLARLCIPAAAALVVACADARTDDAPPADAAPPTLAGAELYSQCATCHEGDGRGLAGLYPPLAGSDIVNGPESTLVRIVIGGLEGPLIVKGERYDGTMLPYGGGPELNDAEVAALLTYVRSSFGNTAGPITEAAVAGERAATAGRVALWTPTELGLR